MTNVLTNVLILITITRPQFIFTKFIETTETSQDVSDVFDNNIIDFEEDISLKVNKKYGILPWNDYNYNKDNLRYTIVSESKIKNDDKVATNDNNLGKTVENLNETRININEKDSSIISNSTNKFNISDIKYDIKKVTEETTTQDYSVIPLELISTTQNILISIIESTTEPDLTVIPLSTTIKVPKIVISETVTLPTSTQNSDVSTIESETVTKPNIFETTEINQNKRQNEENFITITNISEETTESYIENTNVTTTGTTEKFEVETTTIDDPIFKEVLKSQNIAVRDIITTETEIETSTELKDRYKNATLESDEDTDIPLYTELDAVEQIEVPEDYYDAKDVVPTTAPKTDALSVIFGLAGTVVESVVESVAERVVPKGIFDLFKRMQRQSEAIEAEKLRSREENGGIGQFGRGILKSISSGISRPLSQLMAGVRDIGSLDSDRGFVSSLASGVTSVANVANSVVDAFKDRVQAIYPGTVWCGDGRSATARSSDLGLFFFTDTCCRQHDACKIFIRAGETKYGLTNTGLFTRSHCSCDSKFRECLRRTNSLVSAQIGLTYFNVLGPQCFRRAHPIVKCVRRTRITGQKCEEYELDYSKPRMWQWFDNETF